MVHGPRAGLELLEALDTNEQLAGHYRLDAVRGHPFEMAVAGRQQSDTIWRQRLDDEHSGAELSDDQGRPTLHAGKPEILSQ
jgi:hypothetical protein